MNTCLEVARTSRETTSDFTSTSTSSTMDVSYDALWFPSKAQVTRTDRFFNDRIKRS